MLVKSMQGVRCSIAWVLSKCEHIVFSKNIKKTTAFTHQKKTVTSCVGKMFQLL